LVLIRTVIGWLRLVTGLGEKTTCETISRAVDGTVDAGIETSPLGSRIAPDPSGSVTTGDSPERSVVDPAEFLAVMLKRIFLPASAETSRYVDPVAPLIDRHAPPCALQRSHRYENVIGCEPLQEPGSAVRTDPTTALPRTAGSDVFTGPPVTTFVAFDAAVREPSAFVAVTRTLILDPTSAFVRRYRRLFAPELIAQLPPSGYPPSTPKRNQ
jgi:hypothetical protein